MCGRVYIYAPTVDRLRDLRTYTYTIIITLIGPISAAVTSHAPTNMISW